ncbi:MAG: molybdopterin-dependent oxidoreductase [Thermoplasmata archaeon]
MTGKELKKRSETAETAEILQKKGDKPGRIPHAEDTSQDSTKVKPAVSKGHSEERRPSSSSTASRNRPRIIAGVILVAIVVILIAVILISKDKIPSGESGKLSVIDLSGKETNYTVEDLRKMPYVERTVFLKGSEPGTFFYRGVEVIYLINQTENHAGFTYVRAVASDRYANQVEALRILNDGVFVAYEIENKSMSSSKEGGYGPLRLIVPQKDENDFNGMLSVKFLVRLEIKKD